MTCIRNSSAAFLLLMIATASASAAPSDNYRFFTKTLNITVVGSGGELDIGMLSDLAFDSKGTLYGVAQQNGLVVYDGAAQHWRLIDGDKTAILGDVKTGLSAAPTKARGGRQRITLDPERLDRITGYAEQIAIDPDDRVWVTTHDFTIYRQDGALWQRVPGLAKSIEIGADGSIYSMVAEEPPNPRRNPKQMRPKPEATAIQKWNGSGWSILPDVQGQAIFQLAVGPDGSAWIAHRCPMPGKQSSRHCLARWTGNGWQDQTLPNQSMVNGLAFDEHGLLWADIRWFWPDESESRSIMTLSDGEWAQQFNIVLDQAATSFDVYDGTPWLDLYYVDEGRPQVEDGWVRYPNYAFHEFRLTRAGDVWVLRNQRNYSNTTRITHRWFGGNDWSGPANDLLAPFDNAGNWTSPDIEVPDIAMRKGIGYLARVNDGRLVGARAAPQQRAIGNPAQEQAVFRIENGRLSALGAPFRSVSSVAADDSGNAWVKAAPMVPRGEYAPEAYYRFENDTWEIVAMPEGFTPASGVVSGLDNSVTIVGSYAGHGGSTLSTIARWHDGVWKLIKPPPMTSVGYAMTDSDGKIWVLTSNGLMYQEGTQVSFKVPKPEARTVAAQPVAVARESMPSSSERVDPPALSSTRATHSPDFVGCWVWSNGATIVVRENGQAHNGIVAAPWTSTGEGQVEIQWPDFTTTITVAADGAGMTEESFLGKSGGTRLSGSGNSFEGLWRLDNGATATASSDGSYTVGNLRGSWVSVPGARRFEVRWPILDTIVINSDGQSLRGANQIGVFTATKKSRCD